MQGYQTKLLVQLINAKADTASLLKQGLTYSQISRLIVSALSDGYIKDSDSQGLTLTQKGLELIGIKKSVSQRQNAGNWITPYEFCKTEQLNKEDLFLPDKKSIEFLD